MPTNIFLLQNCLNIFFAQGVKVSMDDIAKELGMSKRTLYELFENKSELIYRCISHLIEEEKENMIRLLSKNGGNIIEKLFPFLNFDIYDRMKKHHYFFHDIKRYYPEIFAKVVTAHIDSYLEYIGKIIKEGIEQSLFRNDIILDIVKIFFFSLMTSHNHENKDLFQRYSMVDVFENTILCYIRGISTPKGLKLIDDVLHRNLNYQYQHLKDKEIKE
ncbi:MAG: TetR/AcrR family transcriptional regulator [Bacteroidales bacterium]|jgi:AcrR family transcriptional regulator|nr:TetR/AcrR family transcriptional regulator [Bacteroidales bacterium]